MDDYDFFPAQNRAKLARMLMEQQQPVKSGWNAIGNMFQQMRAEKMMQESEQMAKQTRDQREYDDGMERQSMAEFATMRPRPGVQPATPMDDEGNVNPTGAETPDAFQQRRMELAKQMMAARSPEVRQFALSGLTPQKKEMLTLSKDQAAFERDPMTGQLKQVAAGPKEGPKPGDLDNLIIVDPVTGKPMINELAVTAKGRVAAAGRTPGAPRPHRLQYDPERGITIDLDSGEARPVKQGGASIGAKAVKLPESQQKQALGVKNLQGAITEYISELENFGSLDSLKPDTRATMGTKYNNMMLQAKEAYNLGVLNGPDFAILQQVVTNPLSITGTVTSKGALKRQAQELSRLMGAVGANASGAIVGAPAGGGWSIKKVGG